jgi:hypothetical protein
MTAARAPDRFSWVNAEVTPGSRWGTVRLGCWRRQLSGDSMPRLASERAWYTPPLIIAGVLVLVAVYAILLWVVAVRTPA